MVLHFPRLTRTQLLKRLGRELLGRFLGQFEAEFAAQNLVLPASELDDARYFAGLAKLLSAPETLPDRLSEALFALHEMATPDGQERLEQTAAKLGLPLLPGSSREDLALQVWLADPATFSRLHSQQWIRRLTTFEYFTGGPGPGPRTPPAQLGAEAMNALRMRLDAWFALHQRGHNTTRVASLSPAQAQDGAQGECWFLIRHGDTFTRTPAVEAQETRILHFRPERDDAVVHAPQHDELRVHARTKGERDLYRQAFGWCLHGNEAHFCRREAFTLEPLRLDAAAALEPAGLDGIAEIVLREIELAWDNPQEGRMVREAADLLAGSEGAEQLNALLPRHAKLTRAGFAVRFRGAKRPRPVELRLPNVLKLGRHCDSGWVSEWLWRRGFRVAPVGRTNSSAESAPDALTGAETDSARGAR